MGAAFGDNGGVIFMSKLREWSGRTWLSTAKHDMDAVQVSITEGYRKGNVDVGITISDGSDGIYLDFADGYPGSTGKKKLDTLIKALTDARQRMEDYVCAEDRALKDLECPH